jgi:hypothetical protein
MGNSKTNVVPSNKSKTYFKTILKNHQRQRYFHVNFCFGSIRPEIKMKVKTFILRLEDVTRKKGRRQEATILIPKAGH